MNQESAPTIDELWRAAVDRFPQFSPDEQRTGLVLLDELARGEPVTASRLGIALGITEREADRYLRDSGIGPFVYSDDHGSVLGFFGLSTVPTDHRLILDGRTLWAWCAVDTLFLPELLGASAEVESTDPESGEPIRLTVSPSALEAVSRDEVLISMSSPEAWETTSAVRLIVTACHFIHFFASSESARRWTKTHADTVLLGLEDAFTFGQRQNRRMFGQELTRRAAART